MNIQFTQSPNYTSGRTQPITKIVLHWMVGTLESTDAQFANPASEVSAHYGIEDNTIHQYVKDGDTAWHAKQANPYSIGIEHSAAPGRPASSETILTSAKLVATLCSKHNIAINQNNIIPHSQVVATQCPGTLPIDTIIIKAQAIANLMEDDMPNEGDVHNAYLRFQGRRATPEEVRAYTTKPWNAPDGLYNGKVLPELEGVQSNLKQKMQDAASATGIANIRGDRLNEIAKNVGAKNGDDYKTIITNIDTLKKTQDGKFTPLGKEVYVKK